MRFLSIICFFIFTCTLYATVGPPSLRCVVVLQNGNTQLTWVAPSDPSAEFKNYQLYYSADGTNYSILASVTSYTTTTYTHTGANAHISSARYYLKTGYDSGAGLQYSTSSDSLSSMLLLVNNSQQGLAKLSWNPVHIPLLVSANPWYLIYRKIAAGVFIFIDSAQYGNEMYNDSLKVCDDSVSYRIEQSDVSGCISVSNTVINRISDKIIPAVPVIDSVSVDSATGKVMIGWKPSTSGDAGGYFILHSLDNGSTWLLDTLIKGRDSTFFIDMKSDPTMKPVLYGVAAFDTCWVENATWTNTSSTGVLHQTVLLSGSVNQCNKEINLSWTAYKGWSEVGSYTVFASKDGGAYSQLATILSQDTTYTHTGVIPKSQYCYLVKAVEKNSTSTSLSNKLCMMMTAPVQPEFHYINYVTVAGENSVDISCYVDLKAAVNAYLLKRSDSPTGPFTAIAQLPKGSSSLIRFTDITALTASKIYYYTVAVIDVCDKEIIFSNTSRTILAAVSTPDEEAINRLSWNSYSDWAISGSGVANYNIYKGDNSSGNGFKLAGTSSFPPTGGPIGGTGSFDDNISKDLQSNGKFCYYIEAVESNGDTLGFHETSRSNIVCINHKPVSWIPNAFTPNGDAYNEEFKPVLGFIPASEFLFMVFNRTGEPVFSTDDITKGWDGTVKGTLAPEGMYVYLAEYKTAQDEVVKIRGSLMMFR